MIPVRRVGNRNVSLMHHSQIFEETRTQNLVQVKDTLQTSRELTVLESNSYKCTNIIFLPVIIPVFFKDNHSKTWVCVKLGLIISAARLVIDHKSSF